MGIYQVGVKEPAYQFVGFEVECVFEEALPLLQKALKHADGELSVWDIKQFVARDLMQLWVGYQGEEIITAMVTEIVKYPLKKVVRVVALAGTIKPFLNVFEEMKVWAVANGAVELEAWCRPAMTRLLRRYGFTKRHEIVRCDLRRVLQ